MTGPITTYKEKTPEGSMRMQMCYYVPSEHQANPPQSTVEGVTVLRKGTMKVAARLVKATQEGVHYCIGSSSTHFLETDQDISS